MDGWVGGRRKGCLGSCTCIMLEGKGSRTESGGYRVLLGSRTCLDLHGLY